MANSTQMEQEIRNVFKTELNTELDIDLSQQCRQAVEASQKIKNIQLKGVKDVSISQKNFVENRCVLNSILNLEMLDSLKADVKDELLSKVEQKSAIIPSVNASSTRQKVETIIENKIGLEAKLNLAKKCLQDLTANQSIENVKIKDSLNIDLTQDAVNYNKCFMDGAVEMTKGTDIDIKKETKTEAETKQTGFLASLAGSLGGLFAMPLMSLISPVVICVMLSVSSIGMSFLNEDSNSNSKKKEGAPTGLEEFVKEKPSLDPKQGADEAAKKEPGAVEQILGESSNPESPAENVQSWVGIAKSASEGIKSVTEGVKSASEGLRKAFGSRKGTNTKVGGKRQSGGGMLEQFQLFLSPQYRIYVIIIIVAFLLIVFFGKHNESSQEIRQLERMANTPVSRFGQGGNYNFVPTNVRRHTHNQHNQHNQHKKKPYPMYDPMYF